MSASGAVLARRTAVMAAGTVLSRLTGFGRVFALASVIGFGALTDTYNLANTTPNIVYELVVGGILSATLVPIFVSALASGDGVDGEGQEASDAAEGIAAALTLTLATLVGLTVAFYLLAPTIVALYTSGNQRPDVAQQRAVATDLLRWFAPQVALYGLISVSTALSQVRRRFALPMFAPVANNVVVIAAIALSATAFGDRARTLATAAHVPSIVVILGLGTTAGVAVQALIQAAAVVRDPLVRWRWAPRHPLVRRLVRQSGWTFGFVVANQVALFVVTRFANRDAGALSAYQAAQQFFALPHAIVAVSVISALVPELSSTWATRRVDDFRRLFLLGVRRILVVLVPAAAVYLVLAGDVVEVALEHGAMRPGAADATATALVGLVLGLPGFSVFLFAARAFQSMLQARLVFGLYLLENGLNVATAGWLVDRFGVRGLAASYALAYSTAAVVALVVLRRRLHGLEARATSAFLGRLALSTGALGTVAWVTRDLLATQPALVRLVGAGVAGGLAYLAVARLVGLDDLRGLFRRGT